VAHPEQVSSLVLDAFVWTGKGSPTLEKRKLMLPKLMKSNVRKVDAEFYRGVFTRDEAGAAEPMISELVTQAELKYGDTVPNGTYVDMVTKLPLVDPLKVACPVMIIRPQHDGIATDADRRPGAHRNAGREPRPLPVGGARLPDDAANDRYRRQSAQLTMRAAQKVL
jgi:hypothetical protein